MPKNRNVCVLSGALLAVFMAKTGELKTAPASWQAYSFR